MSDKQSTEPADGAATAESENGDAAEPQTVLETVTDSEEQEILLPLDGEDMTATAAPTTAKQTDASSTKNTTVLTK